MRLRQKIILFAITPLLLAFCAISLTVFIQANSLKEEEGQAIRDAFLKTKDSELKNYVTLATLAISHLYEPGRSDAASKEAAKAILEKFEYSVDGYFFVYDFEGTMIVHPKQREKVGTNTINETDRSGKPLIKDLIRIAKEEGKGYYDYIYEKFSTGKYQPKRAYVVGLPEWGWMLGTGVYLDDIDAAVIGVKENVSNSITNTMLWILAITVLSLLVIISFGLALNIWEQRDTLEKERKRIARELHDGACQKLGAIKYNIEAAILKLMNSTQGTAAIQGMLEEMAGRITKVNMEIRSIAHELHAKILVDFRLEPALRQFAYDYPDTPITFILEGEVNNLPVYAESELYRTTQIALDNIQKHAKASQIKIHLVGDESYVTLEISDDGVGFNLNRYQSQARTGLGLQSIKERLEDERIDGRFNIVSSPDGTTVTAMVPRKPRNKFLINLFSWKSA